MFPDVAMLSILMKKKETDVKIYATKIVAKFLTK